MFAVLMSALLMAAAEPPPSAAAPAAPVVASPGSQKPKTADVTCWDERPTGSHVAKHMCATREELDKAERDARDAQNVRTHPAAEVRSLPGPSD